MKLNVPLIGGKKKAKAENIEVRVIKVLSNNTAKMYDAKESNNSVRIPEIQEKYNIPKDVSSFWLRERKWFGFKIEAFKYYMAFHGVAELATWKDAIEKSRKGVKSNQINMRAIGNAEEIYKMQDLAVLNQLVNANLAPSKSMSILMIIVGIIIGYILCDSGMLAGIMG